MRNPVMMATSPAPSMSTSRQHWHKAQVAMLTSLEELHPESRGLIGDLKRRIESQEINESQISQEMNRIGQCLIQEKDQQSREYRLVAAEIKSTLRKISFSKHLSVEQRKRLEELDINKGESPAEALASIGELCQTFADESIKLRESSSVVVGEGHKHIQQKSGNIIAGDISWSSKQIIKSILPLLKRVNIEFPGRKNIEHNLSRAVELSKSTNVDFFEAIEVMEATTREVTLLQGMRDNADAEYLKNFHTHLKNMHESLRETLLNNSAFSNSADKDTQAFLQMLDNFKDASEAENDPIKLKNLVAKNLESLNANFRKVVSKQDAHIKNQQRMLGNLESDIRVQSKKYEKAIADQDKMKQVIDAISANAMVDHLTGVPNRQAYEKSLSAIDVKLAQIDKKHHGRFGLCVIDVDHFKSINDNYGHTAGDKVLKIVATLIKKLIIKASLQKKIDIYRYGGEEFVLVYKNLSMTDMSKFAEIIRKRISNASLVLDERNTIKVTFSAGIASYTPLDDTGEKVFKTADKAMYQAKQTGRDKVLIYQNQKLKFLKPMSGRNMELSPISV